MTETQALLVPRADTGAHPAFTPTTAERRARALQPTIYCPPDDVERCVDEARANRAEP